MKPQTAQTLVIGAAIPHVGQPEKIGKPSWTGIRISPSRGECDDGDHDFEYVVSQGLLAQRCIRCIMQLLLL